MSVSSGLPSPNILNQSYPASGLYTNYGSDSFVAAALQSLNVCQTPYNTLYFSKNNMNTIQKALRSRIQSRLGYVIDRQDPDDLSVIMRAVYVNWAKEPPCNNFDIVAQHVARLNAVVMSIILPQVASGVVSYVSYLRDASQLPVPLPLPLATSNAGSKNLPIFSGI